LSVVSVSSEQTHSSPVYLAISPSLHPKASSASGESVIPLILVSSKASLASSASNLEVSRFTSFSKPSRSVSPTGSTVSFSSFSAGNQIKSIKITNVGVGSFVEDSDNKLPLKFAEEYRDLRVSTGDLVLALTRTVISAGLKVAIVPDSYNSALLNQRVAAILPNNRLISSIFLYYYFRSKYVNKYVLSNVNTLMQPNLSIKDLKKMPIPFPSLKRQEEIVTNLDSLFDKRHHLQTMLENSQLHNLKSSILDAAFKGKL